MCLFSCSFACPERREGFSCFNVCIFMEPNILDQIKQICKIYGIRPSREKGQNFLINPEIIKKIAAAAGLSPKDTVLEVGPGLGILTEELVKKTGRVVSVELDRKLFDFLKVKFVNVKNLELINEDALNFLAISYKLKAKSYKIVANLPYNITSHFLKKFLTGPNKPEDMTLLLQKEVAQRICAKPGEMSRLSVSVQLYGRPRIIDYADKNNFWPKPAVDSAVLKISEIKSQAEVDNYLAGINEKNFWRIVKIGFSAKRKQLGNNLAAGLKIPASEVKKSLNQANFDEKIRAQNLSVSDWLALAKKLVLYLD